MAAWRAQAAENGHPAPKAKAVIYLFLTGGPSQHETFDLKPDAPVEVRESVARAAADRPVPKDDLAWRTATELAQLVRHISNSIVQEYYTLIHAAQLFRLQE